MKQINRNDIELALDVIEGTRKISPEDTKSFLYDMRLSLLNNSFDVQDLAPYEIDDLRKRIDELEEENVQLQEQIDDLR